MFGSKPQIEVAYPYMSYSKETQSSDTITRSGFNNSSTNTNVCYKAAKILPKCKDVYDSFS